jgi:hypothetical protein
MSKPKPPDKPLFTVWRVALFVTFLFSIALYLPAMMGAAIWDDFELIDGSGFGKNNLVSALTKPFLKHYFRPMTSVSFVIDSGFAKSTPFFYHQTNILLHAVTALLIACLTLAITKRMWAGIAGGLFFAAQPVQIGATAWIGGRTDVLSAFFLAAFMLTLVLYHQSTKKGWLIGSAVLFFLAATAKEQAFAILPAVPLSVYAFGTKKRSDAIRISIPFAIAAVLFVVFWAINAPFPQGSHAGALNTFVVAVKTFAHYSLAFLVPNRASLLTWTLENYKGPIWLGVGALMIVAAVWLFRVLWEKNRSLAWLAVCAFLVYLPISNCPEVPSFVAGPYRCAEAGTAVACLFGAGFGWAVANKKFLIAIPFAANLVGGGMITWTGVHDYITEFDFFAKAAKIDPHFIVGVTHHMQGLDAANRSQESLVESDKLLYWIFGTHQWHIQIKRKGQKALTENVMARLHSNSGVPDVRSLGWHISSRAASLAHLDRTPEAILVEKDALTLSPRDPRINYAYGALVVKTDRVDAIRHWEFALTVSPRFPACMSALAHERVVDHRYAEAVKLLEPVMTDLSWNSNAWLDLADAKIGLKDYKGALAALAGGSHAMLPNKEEIQKRVDQIKLLAK